MIVDMTPSSIRIAIGERTVTIYGEAYHRGYGSPDFVAYRSSLTAWDDGTPISESEKVTIERELSSAASSEGWTLEIE